MNYWWVTRPKRNLYSVPEELTVLAEIALNDEWNGKVGTHISFEDALEKSGLKRVGERRDHGGSGGRTHKSLMESLGLIFIQESTKMLKLTLSGEAIMAGDSPVEIIKSQVLKYQFPSAYSIKTKVNVEKRFKIRPFRFLLRLLSDSRLDFYLTQEEMAKIVIVEAENESEKCYNYIVERILSFRNYDDKCLEKDFFVKYAPISGTVNKEHPFSHLVDIANTLINWLEYTQLAKRNDDKKLKILEEKKAEVAEILSLNAPFIDRPEQYEYFQRKFGVDPKHTKDSRNLTETKTITNKIIAEQKIKQAFVLQSLKKPIVKITSNLIDTISDQTGIGHQLVEATLHKFYPHGAIGSFMSEYFNMAFKGKDEAIEFEKATVELFKSAFDLETEHIGPKGLTPDVLILSDKERYIGIIDNKAYSNYSITNDHKNRMIHNYIKTYNEGQKYRLSFFSYISGGFGKNINSQLKAIVEATNVHGSAISAANVISLVENYNKKGYNHKNLKDIFSIDRQVLMSDL